jgi:UDP-GlcNAc:undecaprenyl-phosphate GlcNAc-1-phosphate transferase
MQINYFFFFFLFFIIFFFTSKFSYKFNLTNFTKYNKHKKKIPYTGGISIIICLLLVQKIFTFENDQINTAISYASIVCLLGFLDDKFNMRVSTRILFQIFIGYLLFTEGFKIISLGKYEFLGELTLGKFSLIFTLFVFAFFLNSNNYIDGINGLSTSLFINSILLILFFYGEILHHEILELTFFFIFISLIFILFNFGLFNLPMTFLGNCGSLLQGFFLLSLSIIILNNYNHIPKLFLFLHAPIILFEFISTNLSRILRSKKIFVGGNDHIHYLISNKFGIYSCLTILNILNFFLGSIFLLLVNYSTILTVIVAIIFFVIFFLMRENLIKNKKFK